MLPENSKRIRPCPRTHEGGADSQSGDRISLLPDDIIIFILSFLNLKEAIVTSALSRRWRHMWAFTKRLEINFRDDNFKDRIRWHADFDSCRFRWLYNRFVKGVTQALRLHKGSTMEEFKVSIGFGLNEKFKREIDGWLKCASAKRVQRLELDFKFGNNVAYDSICEHYKLTYGVVDQTNGTSLKTLSSNVYGINGCEFACFESLKVLCLRKVNVSGEVLEGFLSCCPSLEKLTVDHSWGLVHLKVQGPSLVLKYLEIRTCPKLSAVEICNVNLVTLFYEGQNISWVLRNAPALVNLTIGGHMCQPLNSLSLTQFSCILPQLETLTIKSWNHKTFELEVVDLPLELSNLRKLVLNFGMVGDYSVMGCTPLIKASPKLQRFVLESMWANPTIERRELRWVEKFQHQHIEEVEFRGYYGNQTHLELLMFFLENAASLKKIIVDPNDFNSSLTDAVERSKEELERVKAARRRAIWQLKGQMLQGGVEVKILKCNPVI